MFSMKNAAVKRLVTKLQDAGLHNRVLPELDLSSREVNGSGYFHPPICKLVLHYNTPRSGAGGDSVGIIKYFRKHLEALGRERPYLEIICKLKSGKPSITAMYNNGSEETVLASRWTPHQIHTEVQRMCNSSGVANNKRSLTKSVKEGTGSYAEKSRTRWTAFNAEVMFRP